VRMDERGSVQLPCKHTLVRSKHTLLAHCEAACAVRKQGVLVWAHLAVLGAVGDTLALGALQHR
jgi:hypothetical protein